MAGGLCGISVGLKGTCILTNCYNQGNITGRMAGGLCAADVGFEGSCILTNCL